MLYPDDVEQTVRVDFDAGTATYGYTPLHRQINNAYVARLAAGDVKRRRAWGAIAQQLGGEK